MARSGCGAGGVTELREGVPPAQQAESPWLTAGAKFQVTRNSPLPHQCSQPPTKVGYAHGCCQGSPWEQGWTP